MLSLSTILFVTPPPLVHTHPNTHCSELQGRRESRDDPLSEKPQECGQASRYPEVPELSTIKRPTASVDPSSRCSSSLWHPVRVYPMNQNTLPDQRHFSGRDYPRAVSNPPQGCATGFLSLIRRLRSQWVFRADANRRLVGQVGRGLDWESLCDLIIEAMGFGEVQCGGRLYTMNTHSGEGTAPLCFLLVRQCPEQYRPFIERSLLTIAESRLVGSNAVFLRIARDTRPCYLVDVDGYSAYPCPKEGFDVIEAQVLGKSRYRKLGGLSRML